MTSVELPPSRLSPHAALPSSDGGARAKILLVDDEPSKALAIESVVDELGHELTVATNGEDGLRRLLEQDYSLVLLDIHMPGMDGFELARLIRSRPAYVDLPIVFISAADQTEERLDLAYRLGAADFVPMPAKRSVLRGKISTLLAAQRRLGRHQEEAGASAKPPTDHWRLLVANAHDLAIVFTDPQGIVTEWSPGAERSFGWRSEEIVGQSLSHLFTPEDVGARAPQAILSAALSGDDSVDERWYQRRDGAKFWGSARVVALTDERVHGFGLILRDRTDQKAATDEMERRVAERSAHLHGVIEQLEGFSAAISHDLQAPLRAIAGYTDALLSDHAPRLTNEGRDIVRRIASASTNLQKLVQDVLDHARVPADSITLTSIEVAEIVREITHGSPALQPPRARVLIQEPMPVVAGHRPLLTQVLSNLLWNAAKFVAPNVEPAITVRADVDGDDVVVWVEDNGIGIRSEDRERIFEPLFRAQTARPFKGTGLGLAIVRKAVERMSGTVGVESEPGRGSRFWIRLRRGG